MGQAFAPAVESDLVTWGRLLQPLGTAAIRIVPISKTFVDDPLLVLVFRILIFR